MPSAVRLREDYSAEELRTETARRIPKDVSQSRSVFCRWLRFEMEWTEAAAAKIGGMDRQTLRDLGSSLQRFGAGWLHRPPAQKVPKPRLSEEQLAPVREDRGGWPGP